LAELGYYAAYRVLDAQHFGVPQRRRRVFLVAYLGDWRPAAAVLFESESLRRNLAPSREEGQDITQTLTRRLGSGGPDDNLAQGGFYQVAAPITTRPYADNEAQESKLIVEIAGTLEANYQRQSGSMMNDGMLCLTGNRTHALTAEGHDASEDGTGRGTPIVYQQHGSDVGPVGVLRRGNGSVQGGVPFTLHGTPATAVATASETAVCLRSKTPSGTENSSTTLVLQSAVRRLTPVECERLMGYPDNWTQYGAYANGPAKKIADGPRYQMCGNGWATPVANWVAQRVMMVERLINPSL
jgi:DNA (cytosine-5)-methyltransferase 1